MKKIITAIFVLSSLALSSCSDFLETSTESSLLPPVVYSSTEFTNQAVMGVYQVMVSTDRMYKQTLSITNSTGTDSETHPFSVAKPSDSDPRAMANYLDSERPAQLSGIWEGLYQGVEFASQVVEGVNNSPVLKNGTASEQKLMKSYRAEAVVLRAWFYTELSRIFGNIPFKLETTNSSNMYMGKTALADIYAALVDDLGKYENDLEWLSNSGTAERIGRGFAKGLRARISLYRAGWYFTTDSQWKRMDDANKYYQIAKDECYDVIKNGKHALNPSFKDVFYQQCQRNPDPANESLYEIGMGMNIGSEIGWLLGIRYSNATAKYAANGSCMVATPALFYSYAPNDTRRDVSVTFYGYDKGKQKVNADGKAFFIGKWSLKWMKQDYLDLVKNTSSKKGTGINFCIMRYSDILLMFAEAENALNGATKAAKDALYEVRHRAIPTLSTGDFETYISGKDFQLAIENERMWEFAGESIRKYDLIRWGKLAQNIKKMKEDFVWLLTQRKVPADYWFNADAPIPTKLYYKFQNEDPEDIDISTVNFYATEPATAPAGYESADWFKLSTSADGQLAYLRDMASGLVPGTISGTGAEATIAFSIANNGRPYRPLHPSVIASSRGSLNNDYGYKY